MRKKKWNSHQRRARAIMCWQNRQVPPGLSKGAHNSRRLKGNVGSITKQAQKYLS